MTGSGFAQQVGPIVALARQGRFDEAALAVNRALMEGAEGPVIRALAGAIDLHRRRYAAAAEHLEKAYAAQPDPVVRRHLVEASHHLERWERVLALVDLAWARTDASLQMARLAGHAAQAVGREADAVSYYRVVVAADSRDWTSWNNLGNALAALGKADEAEQALRRTLQLVPDARPTQLNLANLLHIVGRSDEADAILQQMIRADPQDAHPRYSRFHLLFAQRREDEAQEELHQAAQLAPDRADIQADLGQHALRLGLLARAEAAFQASLALQPADGASYVGMASVLELRNREGDLPALRTQAEAAGVEAATLAFIDMLHLRRLGRNDEALAALVAAEPVVSADQLEHLRGILLDRLGRHAEAFASFEAMNANIQADPSAPRDRAADYRARLARTDALLTPEWLASWTPPVVTDPPAPIFLLGFPRSGTTLLDTMLMSDPRVQVLEEEPFIGDLLEELGGVEALPGLSAETLRAARARYFERAARVVTLGADTILVDKHPMHLAHPLIIRRLFPEARFLLALRHPCDAVLSCFLTNFRINDAMANFLDLGDAAALYDLAFTHWQRARTLCDLPVSTVVYEDLVADTQGHLRPVFAQLGLAWPEQGLDHRAAARQRGTVRTASYAQVTEPIYRRAAGRWVHYTGQLAPVMEVLKPWIEGHGYQQGEVQATMEDHGG